VLAAWLFVALSSYIPSFVSSEALKAILALLILLTPLVTSYIVFGSLLDKARQKGGSEVGDAADTQGSSEVHEAGA